MGTISSTYDASTATTIFLLMAERELKGSSFNNDLHMAVLNKAIDISISVKTYTAEYLIDLLSYEFNKYVKVPPASAK